MTPSVFNGVKVWRLSRPIQKLDILLLKPDLGSSGGMLGIIILLENDIICRNSRIPHALQQSSLQNGHILFSIHPSLHLTQNPHTIPPYTAPYHE